MEEKINKFERLRVLLEGSNSAWYMYCTDGFPTYCNIHGSNGNITTYTLENKPEFRQKYIITSIHGWHILDQFEPGNVYKFSIHNSFTLQTIDLPPLSCYINICGGKIKCTFSSPPDSEDCVLLVCFTPSNAMFSCRPTRPDCRWITHRIEIPLKRSVEEILIVDRVMFVVTEGQYIYRLDMDMDMDVDADASLVLRPLHIHAPDIIVRARRFDYDFYMESCSRIYYVKVGLDFDYVKVFELDFNGGCWREIKSLGGRTFFVVKDCCTWCWGTTDESWSQTGIQRNCIYVHLRSFEPFYIYNLQDDSMFPLWRCPNVLGPTDKPVWVIPQHLRLSSSSSSSSEEEKPIDINRIDECNYDNLDEERSKFSELPLEIVQEISKHMHLYEYWNFGATSTMTRSQCPAPQWKTNNQVPLFLYFKNDGTSELIDPCGHGSRFHSVPFFSDPFALRFSNNGWVLAMVGKSLQYFDFFTGSIGEYPNPPEENDFLYLNSIAFSTYPTCSDCLTIGIRGVDDGEKVVIYYLEAEKGTWKSWFLEDEGDQATFFNASESCPIFFAGAFYILDMQGTLLVFQLVNGEPTSCVYARPQNLKMFYASHLVESEGELYSVFIDEMGQRVQVFKFDKLMKHWIEVESLENCVFFISQASSFSIATTDQRLRNRIYFPRLYKKGLLFYSLDTRKFHSLTSDDIIEDFYGTSEPLRCCWV